MNENLRPEAAHDVRLAELMLDVAKKQRYLDSSASSLHHTAGHKMVQTRSGGYWRDSIADAIEKIEPVRDEWTSYAGYRDKGALLDEYAKRAEALATARAAIVEHEKSYTGWIRFFLVPGGHLHSSTNCHTCNKGQTPTTFVIVPTLSGLFPAEAVDVFGPALCSICFPDAPVQWLDQVKVPKSIVEAAQAGCDIVPLLAKWHAKREAKEAK